MTCKKYWTFSGQSDSLILHKRLASLGPLTTKMAAAIPTNSEGAPAERLQDDVVYVVNVVGIANREGKVGIWCSWVSGAGMHLHSLFSPPQIVRDDEKLKKNDLSSTISMECSMEER